MKKLYFLSPLIFLAAAGIIVQWIGINMTSALETFNPELFSFPLKIYYVFLGLWLAFDILIFNRVRNCIRHAGLYRSLLWSIVLLLFLFPPNPIQALFPPQFPGSFYVYQSMYILLMSVYATSFPFVDWKKNVKVKVKSKSKK
ncbi:hypothetical protein [Paenibacillus pinihumi]|uniref:hypothetical protein n=1 Tax=Paenibacillus pinihumi TaxID=669462 RepID=UPI00048BECDA|nr:hypothetical protein [Paenibacillus pinihumi]